MGSVLLILVTPSVWCVYGVASWILSFFGVDRLDRVALSFLAALIFIICVSVGAWDEMHNGMPNKASWLRWMDSRRSKKES